MRKSLTIVSGGQTGIDRLALDVAIELGIDHGGWCPRGRRAEDGSIPALYCLSETDSASYHVRTERNIADSDATLVLHFGTPVGGTKLTIKLARQLKRPLLALDFQRLGMLSMEDYIGESQTWLVENAVGTLNVAGPRQSSAPELPDLVRLFLVSLLTKYSQCVTP